MFDALTFEVIDSKQPCSIGVAEIVVSGEHQPIAGEKYMTFVSNAQSCGDVILRRVFKDKTVRFHIEVPTVNSHKSFFCAR